MNYIKKLQKQNNKYKAMLNSYAESLQDLEKHLSSSKFTADWPNNNFVNPSDVISRIHNIRENVGTISYKHN